MKNKYEKKIIKANSLYKRFNRHVDSTKNELPSCATDWFNFCSLADR